MSLRLPASTAKSSTKTRESVSFQAGLIARIIIPLIVPSEHSGKQMILPITNQLKDTILESLHPLAEQWSGVRLLGTSVYGIRRYRAGSWLATHVDKGRDQRLHY